MIYETTLQFHFVIFKLIRMKVFSSHLYAQSTNSYNDQAKPDDLLNAMCYIENPTSV